MADHSYSVVNFQKKFQCLVCDKVFCRSDSLQRHIKSIHRLTNNGSVLCKEKGCDYAFQRIKDLIQHLQTSHNITMKTEKLSFKDNRGFCKWKDSEESHENVRFVKDTGSYTTVQGSITYLRCHRSGKYRDHVDGVRKRKLKSQGSFKIGFICTSSMKVITREDNSVAVYYIKTHYGHNAYLGLVNLLESDKNCIAGKLIQGVNMGKVLKQVRDSLSDGCQRIHLITRKDILNIEKSYGLSGSTHDNDMVSITAWVEKKRKETDNPVILFKNQGISECGLEEQDFMLVLMTQVQCQILKKFHSIICMDGTHGTNPYDFTLVSILVIDKFGEGFPVAFCYTNREDRGALTLFLHQIRKKVGFINCKNFMSDDAPQYFQAWKTVMEGNTTKLLCSWHVDRAWRGNIKLIKNQETQVFTYKLLKTLQTETDEMSFEKMFMAFKEILEKNKELEDFGKYFLRTYGNRTGEWAYCYRKRHINTNMYLESLHKVIKHIYMGGMKVRRLDKSVLIIMNLIKDKCFERLIKLFKKKNTYKLNHIQDRHTKAVNMSRTAVVSALNNNKWMVTSKEDASSNYIVSKNVNLGIKDCKCEFRCLPCQSCIHMLFCTCVDFVIKGEYCKHLYLVQLGQLDVSEQEENCTNELKGVEVEADALVNSLKISNHFKKQELAISLLQECIPQIANTSCETKLEGVLKHCKDIKAILNINVPPFQTETYLQPVNKKITNQLRFKSTNRKRQQNTNKSLKKPSHSEMNDLRNLIINNTVF